MEAGEVCICQYEDWKNAFGDESYTIPVGTKLTVTRTWRLNGTAFLCFEGYDPDVAFLAWGFKAMRTLN